MENNYELLKQLVKDGKKVTEMAIIFKTSKKTIRYHLNKLGIWNKTPVHYREENFKKLVKESLSIKEFCQKVKISDFGSNGNYQTFKKYAKLYNVDYGHFNPKKEKDKNTFFQKKQLSEILIENSTYNTTSSLKKRLYNEGFKQRQCEKCGQGEIWMGDKISLILDHINGDNVDNRIENLRILCPNCNAATPTFCRGLKSTKKRKIENEKLKNNGITIKVSNKFLSSRLQIRPPYEQLKSEIKELGYTGTGKKYGISDNGIRRWIKTYEKYNI